MSENQFNELLDHILPKLEGRPPILYKLSTAKKPQLFDVKTPNDIKQSKYKGVIIVSTATSLNPTSRRAQRPQPSIPEALPPPPPEAEPNPPASFQEALQVVIGGLNAGTQQILVQRENIASTAESLYSEDSILSCRGLFVQFEGELGVDLEGVTRDFFSSYWRSSLTAWLGGHNNSYFKLSPGIDVSKERLEAMGRILLHGYLVCGFLPIYLNNASLFYVLTGKMPTKEFFKESFLACLDEKASRLVQQGESAAQFSSELQHNLLVYFSQHEFLNCQLRKMFMIWLLKFQSILEYQPFFILSGMKYSSS